MIILNFMIIIIISIMTLLINILSKKSYNDREKSSPFECGFDPKTSARLPFSLQFFLIAIIFLIFDIEITLLLPFILMINYSNMLFYFLINFFFIFILIIGLYHEWNQGALQWIY
uniref:NADH-ubiquinone oxidoreductase chain 3 n=1 Tax=Monotoma quadricollis TaxID=346807 RepID=A0A343A3P0_9CUCU|nr:NADH dehydrogenase subunit 3 [Monotoma quadricollis]AOY39168.1 NADH dehydrogenase subunit 3 [Monotoma quadricollis]